MENVILIILLILALALIAVVLMQRSEGGGLGMGGGGGGGGGAMSSRSAATALTKVTWVLGVAFMCAALTMTIIAARNASGSSVVDQLGLPSGGGEAQVPAGEGLLPPTAGDAEPLVPVAE